ncbi:carbohydrate-binding domain-containing protein [Siphonobacter sp. BAB-5405]|uniref:carbohydrate-binding domain-containing protein n=1 Tax=Siphonobacter sp. BAB-5405 TaxID=1864825 RepID=UPI002101A7EA|nr:carbohydrate-binding domain-containing protein [Siphonobacter sp. BAB-5405]
MPSAVSDGIHTNEAFIADGGTVTMTTKGDGIQCEEGYVVINDGTFTINVADKGIAASYDTDTSIDPYLTINGGTINITSTAGEGIESKSVLTINSGNISVKTFDDGLNAGTFIYINGGTVYANSSSNDGIDSNGKLTVTGGKVVSIGAAAPEEGFDCDRNTFKITGGILVGMGGATSTPTASVSTQPSVIMSGGSANQLLHIESNEGAEVLTLQLPKTFTTLLFSSPKLKTGQSYRVYSGGSVNASTTFNGLYTSGTYTAGTQSGSFTASTMVTNAGGNTGR